MDGFERERLIMQKDGAAGRLDMTLLPKLHLGFLVKKEGKILHEHDEVGHSWTRNAWNIFFGVMGDAAGGGVGAFGAGYLSAKETSGSVHSTNNQVVQRPGRYNDNYGYINNIAQSVGGILVGSGDTHFTIEDYQLAALIEHGTGAGQLSYLAMAPLTSSYESGTKVWSSEIGRLFNNNSGGSITIKEVGLAWYGYAFGTNAPFLVARDVLGSPVAVANGAQLTVTYTISMDFSSIDT
jgi:hypothetical protein